MSGRVFFIPSRFHTLSFRENGRETGDIHQAINSLDYANEMPGARLSQNSWFPGRMLWTRPSSALPAQIRSPGQRGSPLRGPPSPSALAGRMGPSKQQQPQLPPQTEEEPGPWETRRGGRQDPSSSARSLLHNPAGEGRGGGRQMRSRTSQLCQPGCGEGTGTAAISSQVEGNRDPGVDAKGENLGIEAAAH